MKTLLIILLQGVMLLAQGVVPAETSLVALIANPAEFHEKKVIVRGLLAARFEDDALYLNKEDASYLISNAVWVNRPQAMARTDFESLNGQYVEIIGVFDKNQHGHGGAFRSALTKVESITKLKKYYK